MEIRETGILGLVELYPKSFSDQRGFFFEAFREDKLREFGITDKFQQDNQSFSKKGVLRGLHLQKPPHQQAKLVRVISGKVLDVVVDLRPGSVTFGKVYKYELDGGLNNMLYVPSGFAHGFAALEDSVFFYKCSALYNKESESGIIWNDPVLNIDWGIDSPIVSEKDMELPSFEDFKNAL